MPSSPTRTSSRDSNRKATREFTRWVEAQELTLITAYTFCSVARPGDAVAG
jgi:hypothetical protein